LNNYGNPYQAAFDRSHPLVDRAIFQSGAASSVDWQHWCLLCVDQAKRFTNDALARYSKRHIGGAHYLPVAVSTSALLLLVRLEWHNVSPAVYPVTYPALNMIRRYDMSWPAHTGSFNAKKPCAGLNRARFFFQQQVSFILSAA